MRLCSTSRSLLSMSLKLTSSVDANAYRKDLDGLRALAVLSVVAFHIGLPGVPGGFVGVDIFFVLSGFLINGLLRRELLRSADLDFKAFYARRIRRLAPALVLVVCATALIGYVVMLPGAQASLGREVRSVALLSANLHFLDHVNDYFSTGADLTPLLHMWSLSVEEQYYLLWPILFLLIFRTGKNNARDLDRRIRLTLLAILLCSLTLCLWLSYHNQPQAFYLMPARAWEFAAGALLAQMPKPPSQAKRWATALTLLGLLLLLGAVVFLDERMVFPCVIVFIPVLGSLLFILGGMLDGDNPLSRWAGAEPWRSIGILSYGLYLWHWPLLVMGRYWGLGERDLSRDFLLGGVLALVLAWASYRWVEAPLRRGTWRHIATPRNTLKTGLKLTIGLWLLGTLCMYLPKHFPWVGQRALLQAQQDAMSFPPACDMPKEGIPLAPREQCALGPLGAPIKLLAWGDSHTDHLLPMYLDLAKGRRIAILRRVYDGCPPLADAMPVGEGKRRYWCPAFARAVRQELPELARKGLSGVLVDARWDGYAALDIPGAPPMAGLVAAGLQGIPSVEGDLHAGVAPLDRASSLRVLSESLNRLASELQQLGLKMVVALPEPELRYSAPECVTRRGAAACNVPRRQAEAQRQDVVDVLKAVAARHANVRLWDPIDQFCDAQTCFASRDGKLRYLDSNHITKSMALTLSDSFRPVFTWALAPW